MPYSVRAKVLAYIIRENRGRRELLVFDHVDFPEAGTQVPAGSLDPGEEPQQGVLREAFEESGVLGLAIDRYIGCFPYEYHERQELHRRHVFVLTVDGPLPDEWVHVVTAGEGDKGLRFRYFWIDVADARGMLAGDQGEYLDAAIARHNCGYRQ